MAVRGINKVILVGRLGKDPEVRYIPNGGAVANLQVATSESWRDKQTGEMREQTEWHRVVLFGKLAEVAGECLRKGAQVYIEGQLRTRSWEDTGTRMSHSQQTREPVRPTPTILPVPWCHTSAPFTPKKVPVCMNMPRTPVSQKHPGK